MNTIHIYDHILLSSSYNEKYFSKCCTENQNTHFVFNNFFRKSTLYEILWENMAKPGTPLDYNTAHEHCLLDN